MDDNKDMNGALSLRERLAGIPSAAVEALKRPQVWGFFLSLAVIAVVAMAFFYPDAPMGNELRQHDMQQGAAIGHEAQQWMEDHPGAEQPRWTNSLFSGMPTFQISPTYPSNSLFDWISTVYGAGLPSPSNLLFMMMAGMLICGWRYCGYSGISGKQDKIIPFESWRCFQGRWTEVHSPGTFQ